MTTHTSLTSKVISDAARLCREIENLRRFGQHAKADRATAKLTAALRTAHAKLSEIDATYESPKREEPKPKRGNWGYRPGFNGAPKTKPTLARAA